jgi:hypothetical protein
MLVELAIALSVMTVQDSCVIDTNSLYSNAYYTACAGSLSSWEDVLDFRLIANKEGFGSVASPSTDGAYTLSFILFGDSSTVHTQWIRLNELLGLKLTLRRANFGEVNPVATIKLPRPKTLKSIVSLNVSSWDQRRFTIKSIPPREKEPVLERIDTSFLAETRVDSAKNSQINGNNDLLLGSNQLISTAPSKNDEVLVEDAAVASTSKDTATPARSALGLNKLNIISDNAETTPNKKRTDNPLQDTTAYTRLGLTKSSALNTHQKTAPNRGLLQKANQEIATNEHITPGQEAHYFIVFGSYEDRKSATRLLKKLQVDGIQAEIKTHKAYYRVVLYFDYYPSNEKSKYSLVYGPCWIATVGTRKSLFKN